MCLSIRRDSENSGIIPYVHIERIIHAKRIEQQAIEFDSSGKGCEPLIGKIETADPTPVQVREVQDVKDISSLIHENLVAEFVG